MLRCIQIQILADTEVCSYDYKVKLGLATIALLGIACNSTLAFAAGNSAEDECGRCQVKIEAKKKLKDSEAEYTDLLRRNKEFLAKIGPDDNSKLIKLSSNITLINIKLDGIHKNIAELDADLSKEDCAQCVPGSDPSGKPKPKAESGNDSTK
jgi:hypothetical protein